MGSAPSYLRKQKYQHGKTKSFHIPFTNEMGGRGVVENSRLASTISSVSLFAAWKTASMPQCRAAIPPVHCSLPAFNTPTIRPMKWCFDAHCFFVLVFCPPKLKAPPFLFWMLSPSHAIHASAYSPRRWALERASQRDSAPALIRTAHFQWAKNS